MRFGLGRAALALAISLVAGLLIAAGGQAGGPEDPSAGSSGKSSSTYALSNRFVKGFGYVDESVGVRKPKKYGLAVTSFVLLEAKLKSWKKWGKGKAVGKAKKLKVCDPDRNTCNEGKGTLTLKNPVATTCKVNGKDRRVHLYANLTAKLKNGKKADFQFSPDKKTAPDCPKI